MLLKYFYDEKVAHASYMVGCQATGEAIIVDPCRDVDMYLEAAEENGMRIIASTETHIHADFVSGSRELAERVGAKLYLSDEGDENWKYGYQQDYDHQLVYDGDSFMVGNIKFEIMHTPGHTPEHISFILTDMGGGADKPMGIFTGDFVFVGSIGRPDLLEEAAGIMGTARPGAEEMFKSVERFKQLPEYMQVWPAHGAGSACGKGLGAIPSSTIGYEKLFNPAMVYDEEEEFVEDLLSEQPEAPFYFAVMKHVNKVGPKVLHGIPTPEHLPAARLPELIAAGEMVIDTRSKDSFAASHLAGTINIPRDELSVWAGWIVDYEKPLYLIIDSEEAKNAVRDLIYIGIDNVAGYFEPSALEVLAEMGMQLEAYQVTRPREIADQILNGEVTLVDVRGKHEWDEGRLPNAQHLMLGHLLGRADEVSDEKPVVVQCRSGNRSAIAASILQAKGIKNITNLMGGYRDWAAAELPIER